VEKPAGPIHEFDEVVIRVEDENRANAEGEVIAVSQFLSVLPRYIYLKRLVSGSQQSIDDPFKVIAFEGEMAGQIRSVVAVGGPLRPWHNVQAQFHVMVIMENLLWPLQGRIRRAVKLEIG
jgi:hypothetical protein